MVLAINPNSQEAEADGSYESGLHSEFQANGEYSEACLKQTNKYNNKTTFVNNSESNNKSRSTMGQHVLSKCFFLTLGYIY